MEMLETAEQVKQVASRFFGNTVPYRYRSKVSGTVYPLPGGALIVTSDRVPGQTKRRFTVRRCTIDGVVSDVSAFQEYAAYTGAHYRAYQEWEARLDRHAHTMENSG